MGEKFESDNNIVDLKEMRQKARQKRAQQAKNKPGTKDSARWFVFLQTMIFLVVLAYFLQKCKG